MASQPSLPTLHPALIHSLLKAITDVQVSSNAKAVFSKAAGLFVMLVASVANDFCREEHRHTVSSADIVRALREIDFAHFIANLPNAP